MKIAIASDHGGYEYKQELIPYMETLGHQVLDLGCHGPESVDYPDFGIPCAQAVARGEVDRGVVICGTGIGISISANKVPGIRCALCTGLPGNITTPTCWPWGAASSASSWQRTLCGCSFPRIFPAAGTKPASTKSHTTRRTAEDNPLPRRRLGHSQ